MSPSGYIRCVECRAMNESRALFCSRCGASLYARTAGGDLHKRRRLTAAGAVQGLALLLVLAAVALVLYVVVQRALDSGEEVDPFAGLDGTTATITTVASGESGGSNSPSTIPGRLIRPKSVEGSSALKATSTNNYRATNLIDGDLATAWNEGAEGVGLGESVTFQFSQQLALARIEVANGFQQDDDRFLANPRVKTLQIEYSSGTVQLVDLLDAQGYQTILPTRQPIEWIKMTIVAVHPDYEWEDTALSEVRFYARTD